MDILSTINMAGNRVRNLPAAAANDEPLRKDQATGGGGGGGGAAIQFQDQGTDLGGTDADTVDFVGALIEATRSGSTITVTTTMPDGSDIAITDAGHFFTGTNVETALQELGAAGSVGSTGFYYGAIAPTGSGVASGFRWANSSDGRLYTYVDDGDSQQWVEF